MEPIQEKLQFSKKVFDSVFKAISQKLDIKNPTWLGSGKNGRAYRFDDKVLKITKDESEAEVKYKLIGQNMKHLSKIYEVYRININSLKGYGYKMDDNIFVIIQEFIPHDLMYYPVWYNFFLRVVVMIETFHLPLDSVKDILAVYKRFYIEMQELEKFPDYYYIQFLELLREMNQLGIDSVDFNPHNFGITTDKRLVFYDIGFAYGGIYVSNELVL